MPDIERAAGVLKPSVFELVIPSRINYYADLYTKGDSQMHTAQI